MPPKKANTKPAGKAGKGGDSEEKGNVLCILLN